MAVSSPSPPIAADNNIIDNSPWMQVTILGFVTFCSVGMYSAISGLGAGGTQDPQLSDIAHGALYGCFAVSGFFAGSVNVS
jgi:hypothetical protein